MGTDERELVERRKFEVEPIFCADRSSNSITPFLGNFDLPLRGALCDERFIRCKTMVVEGHESRVFPFLARVLPMRSREYDLRPPTRVV